jgi:hypothetical protein
MELSYNLSYHFDVFADLQNVQFTTQLDFIIFSMNKATVPAVTVDDSLLSPRCVPHHEVCSDHH